MNKNKAIDLIKNISLFFIASFVPKVITFFMIPLYTFCLTREEYGIIDLLDTTVQLLLPFFTLQVQDAMLRFSIDKNDKKEDVYTVGIRIVFFGALIVTLLYVVLKLTGILSLDWIYILFSVILYVTAAIRNISSFFCRGINKIKHVTGSNILYTVVVVLCNLIFLLVLDWGVNGYLAALCAGNVISTLVLFFGAQLHTYIKFTVSDKNLTREIILFSIPMIFSALSWWANNSLDKYVLRFFWDTAAVGLLAVAYKIPSILSLLGHTVANAYSISAIKEFDIEDTDGFLGQSYYVINICYVLCCSFLMLLNIPLSRILFAKDFYSAWVFVPPLLVAALASQMSLVCQQYFLALKKTKIISATAIAGTIINLLLNIILIPEFCGYGAAIATAASFSAVWLMRVVIVQKYIKLNHNLFQEGISYVLLSLQLVLAFWGNKFILYQSIISFLICLLYLKDIVLLAKSFLKVRTDKKI